jgi:hypothetical protein
MYYTRDGPLAMNVHVYISPANDKAKLEESDGFGGVRHERERIHEAVKILRRAGWR